MSSALEDIHGGANLNNLGTPLKSNMDHVLDRQSAPWHLPYHCRGIVTPVPSADSRGQAQRRGVEEVSEMLAVTAHQALGASSGANHERSHRSWIDDAANAPPGQFAPPSLLLPVANSLLPQSSDKIRQANAWTAHRGACLAVSSLRASNYTTSI